MNSKVYYYLSISKGNYCICFPCTDLSDLVDQFRDWFHSIYHHLPVPILECFHTLAEDGYYVNFSFLNSGGNL